MVIKTERLSVRAIEESDWQRVKEIWEDFNSSKYARFDKPHNISDEDVKPRIAKWAAANRDGIAHMFFAICFNCKVIGYVAFNERKSGYEMGYCFHSAYHGKGFAKESLTALFEYLCGLGITEITVGTAMKNVPSVALLKSLDFVQVGTEKVSFYKDGGGNDITFDGGIFELSIG